MRVYTNAKYFVCKIYTEIIFYIRIFTLMKIFMLYFHFDLRIKIPSYSASQLYNAAA